jgi:hypothetical protein
MIVLNNLLVVGALNAIKEKGLMIPQDIAGDDLIRRRTFKHR